VAPDFLDHLALPAMLQHDVGMVAPKIYYHHDPQLIWFAGGRINFWTGRTYHRGLRKLDLPGHWHDPGGGLPEPVDYLTGCALLVKRECIEKIGLLDERYFMYAEDTDWCWRARQAGFVCLYQPQAKVWHKVGATAGGPFKIYHKVRSNFLFFRRYARWYHWPTILLGVAAGTVVEAIRHPEIIGVVLRSFRDILLRRKIRMQAPHVAKGGRQAPTPSPP
jgi:GT2 family glycosyltransferase